MGIGYIKHPTNQPSVVTVLSLFRLFTPEKQFSAGKLEFALTTSMQQTWPTTGAVTRDLEGKRGTTLK